MDQDSATADSAIKDAALNRQEEGENWIVLGWIMMFMGVVTSVWIWVGWRVGSDFWLWWTVGLGAIGLGLSAAGVYKRMRAARDFAAANEKGTLRLTREEPAGTGKIEHPAA